MRKTLWDIAEKHIEFPKLKQAKEYARTINDNIPKALLETNAVTDVQLAEMWYEMYPGYDIINGDEIKIDTDIFNIFDISVMQQFDCIFFDYNKNSSIKIAMANPKFSLAIENYISETVSNTKCEFYIMPYNDILMLLNSQGTAVISNDFELSDDLDETPDEEYFEASTFIKSINKIIETAAAREVSDIHIEPRENETVIRFRKDGVLEEALVSKKSTHNRIINVFKEMAHMDSTNARIIQDGTAMLEVGGKEVNIRVGISPTINGEKATLRLLNNKSVKYNIDMLGFNDKNKTDYLSVIEKPNGIILFTGPTGSGKTTALFATLQKLNSKEKSIVTIEDPVEIVMDGITQVQCDISMGVTFDKAIKGFLRQDPDIILVGEIRDEETAKAAVTAANTGHVVFSTLHTNSACSSIVRLEQLGLKRYMIVDSLNAVVNQRLVRTLCPHCKEEYILSPKHPAWKLFGEKSVMLYKAVGCSKCNDTGYIGRISVSELFIPDDEIRTNIMEGATVFELEKLAVQKGMCSIYEDAKSKALSGVTSIEELHKTVYFNEWGY